MATRSDPVVPVLPVLVPVLEPVPVVPACWCECPAVAAAASNGLVLGTVKDDDDADAEADADCATAGNTSGVARKTPRDRGLYLAPRSQVASIDMMDVY
jgi:hypothetical protein